MQLKSINPYSTGDDKIKEALDFIIANLPASPTFEQLNEVLLTAVFGADPGAPANSDVLSPFIYSILPLTYNGYVNGDGNGKWLAGSGHTNYNEKQIAIIHHLLQGIGQMPFEKLGDFITGMDDSIAASGLPYQQQLPLFVATFSAKRHHQYWSEQLATPGTWALYLNTDAGINYLHAPSWVSAAAQGALLSYGIIQPAQAAFPDLFCAIPGTIGLSAGKVVFGWVPNPLTP